MKSFFLLTVALLATFGYEADSKLVTLGNDLALAEPLKCDTKEFKHDRFDGEAFDLEAQLEEKTVTIEKDETSGQFHLSIKLDEERSPKYFLGNWTCGANSWVVVGAPFIARLGKPSDENKLRPSLAVMEEEKVKLRCEAYYFGADNVDIDWAMTDEETGASLNLTNKWEITPDPEKEGDYKYISTMTLTGEDGVQMSDRANYTCTVSVGKETAMRGILLRVKGKFAALWPFLGICAEVIILCVGIFIYERRTKARNNDVDEEEEIPDTQVVGGDEAKTEDVRKRPVKT